MTDTPVTPMPFLIGQNVYLRAIELEDLPRMQRWMSDPETRRFTTESVPFNATDMRRWYDEVICSPAKADMYMAIVAKDGDRHVGYTALRHIEWRDRNASTTTMIGEKDVRGKGYAPEAKELLLEYAFETLGLHRITCRIISENVGSIKSVLKNGFVQEGIDRESIWREGAWRSDVRFGLLASEWRELRIKKAAEKQRTMCDP